MPYAMQQSCQQLDVAYIAITIMQINVCRKIRTVVDALQNDRLWCIDKPKSGHNFGYALNSLAKMIASAISAKRLPLLIAMLRMRLYASGSL